MADYYAKDGKNEGNTRKTIARKNLTATAKIEGTDVIWNISAAASAFNITVRPYVPTRTSQFTLNNQQPVLVIKCSADCSANNVAVLSSDGAGGTTTHYTFAADYSTTPRYVVLRISATRGADGTFLWQVA